VEQLLRETPPDGDHFAKMVQHTLEREENWITWKNKGCPTYDRERPKTETPLKKSRKRAMGEDIKEAEDSKRVNMGSAELTRLWNLCPDNMEACSSPEREFLPSLEEFFEEAIEQSDPEAMVEDEYKLVFISMLSLLFWCLFNCNLQNIQFSIWQIAKFCVL
ncbi:THO complex subunit 1-like, partial [Branchiostoma floridae]|uniref:THO complex subunit 1-like n=1 Tax=Branchiostoma floridae TaxID=7739 RepID=A0A9J7HXK1_BRAFL